MAEVKSFMIKMICNHSIFSCTDDALKKKRDELHPPIPSQWHPAVDAQHVVGWDFTELEFVANPAVGADQLDIAVHQDASARTTSQQ